jgi:hypothetical protein
MSPLVHGALLLFLALVPARLVAQDEADPAEVAIGERLFLETRFAEFFARNATDVNLPLPTGDPVVATTDTPRAALPGPFAGGSINCRACHLVDEQLEVPGGGMRTYTDFARRSPVPAREDGRLTAVRNSPPLVNASLPRSGGLLLHFDGEFATLEGLVRDTLTGRNYGWLPGESTLATAHVARVIREDDGSGDLGQAFGGSYARVLKGTDPALPEELRLRRRFRLNVERASDEKILDTVARLVAAYVRQLEFERSDSDAFVGSPFDRFLELNALPRVPWKHETPQQYSERLRRAVERIRSPRFVAEGPFLFHDQERRFGALELAGLRVFLADVPEGGVEPGDLARGGVGNCAACHPAPLFTDFRLHNTGVSQLGYDEVHGDGSFLALDVPDLARRNLDPNAWLPATARHPNAREPFRAIPRHGDPGLVDLGAWNVFATGSGSSPARSPPSRRRGCATCRTRRPTCTTAPSTRSRT